MKQAVAYSKRSKPRLVLFEITQQLTQNNKQQLNFQPHDERRRAGNQLEAIQSYNDVQSTGLRESVVLLDHIDTNHKLSQGSNNSQMGYSQDGYNAN